ncbi:hypothetical protein K474DRAFT_1640323 [Panus rudis PR-1116 ss-1]|nr:hypothetical protein K474DRAFT_1640323 [Panus rudis PR-1116 ss-1]
MSEPHIRSAFTLPAVNGFPSTDCLQWSDDGQAIILTRNSIYILTPSIGLNPDPTLLVKQVETLSEFRDPIQWLRTIIECEEAGSNMRQWSLECQDWATVSLGSLDPYFRRVSCSPSNLTAAAGCVIAVLTSNSQVSVWCPVKNHIKGMWLKVADAPDLQDESLSSDVNPAICRTLQAQVTSIAWSPQAHFAITPAPVVDGSMLAIGDRAGMVALTRSGIQGTEEAISDNIPRLCMDDASNYLLKHVVSVSVGDDWVIDLAWTSWRSSQPGQSEAFIACTLANGSISIVKVIQYLNQNRSAHFASDFSPRVAWEMLDEPPNAPSGRSITALKWVQPSAPETLTLIFTTPGELHMWRPQASNVGWSGTCGFALQVKKTTVGSSALSPPSGIVYNGRHDAVTVSLSDGSFHVIHNFSVSPTLSTTETSEVSSTALTGKVRSVFLKLEESVRRTTDVNRIDGMMTFDGDGTFAWIHENFRPSEFDYKHDARHSITFAVAQLSPAFADEDVLAELKRLLSEAQAALGETPVSFLRPLLLHLQDTERLNRIHERVYQILSEPQPSINVADALPLPIWSGEVGVQVREDFTRSLRAHLTGWDSAHRRRSSYFIARYCEQRVDPAARPQFAALADTIAFTVRHQVLLVLLKHIMIMAASVSDGDAPFLQRMIVQALRTPDLSTEVRTISVRLSSILPNEPNWVNNPLSTSEMCPACRSPISFDDFSAAQCPNGHTWKRCSITSFILSTPMVRTCVGCNRKAFAPRSREDLRPNWLPPPARSWLVEDLLHAVRRCLYCGNNFVTLV